LISDTEGSQNVQLRDKVAKLLPDYMIPSAFVWLERFPLTTNGKIDKRALPKAELKRPELAVPYRKPADEIEKQVSFLLADILQYDRVGTDDNFFELGGNSLLMQTFVAELRNKLNFNIPITKLYQYPTVAGLAAQIND